MAVCVAASYFLDNLPVPLLGSGQLQSTTVTPASDENSYSASRQNLINTGRHFDITTTTFMRHFIFLILKSN